jgi:hypothetical protein
MPLMQQVNFDLDLNVAVRGINIGSMCMHTTSAINNSGNTLCLFNCAIPQLFVVILLEFFMFGKFGMGKTLNPFLNTQHIALG